MGKRYEKEFKIEAVRLASEPGNTQAKVERHLSQSTWGPVPKALLPRLLGFEKQETSRPRTSQAILLSFLLSEK